MRKTLKFLSFPLLVGMCLSQAHAAPLPSPELRARIFKALASEMERVDGIALEVRSNRPRSWAETLSGLERELQRASTPAEVVRVFRRLDLAYPNLHSKNRLGPGLAAAMPGLISPALRFDAQWTSLDQPATFRINQPEDADHGAEVIAINDRPIAEWAGENLNFCKYPLRGQCDRELFSRLENETLDWTRAEPLNYTLRQGDVDHVRSIPLRERAAPVDPSGFEAECGSEKDRYPGFTLAYRGNRACVFQSDTDPATALLRIKSFAYFDLGENAPIWSTTSEVNALAPWWNEHATWSHLLIDVIGNTGGQDPIAYYQLLFTEDFQEEYARFRKTRELGDADFRFGLFWGSNAQEIWFQNLLLSGEWARIPEGGLLPPVPMFCADEAKDCATTLFKPRPHPFRGRISVLMNQRCVSSCDGFVWNLKDVLGERARFYGQPNAADGNYSRVTLAVYLDGDSEASPEGFRIRAFPNRPAPTRNAPEPWLSQSVAITRSTSASGELIDGRPNALDGFVPWTIETMTGWERAVLDAALKDRATSR